MAFDAPRKTLDEIRRELEEEFGGASAVDTPSAHTPSDHEATPSDHEATPSDHEATPSDHEATPSDHEAAASDPDDRDRPLDTEDDADARSVPRPPTNAVARRMSNVSRVSDVTDDD